MANQNRKKCYTPAMKKLPGEFFLQDTLAAARSLIGCYLVRPTEQGTIVGRINETEAYIGPDDRACHGYGNRRTPRNEALFAAGGIAYVYFIYGMHYCLNAVTGPEGVPCAVLIRGAEIVEGLDIAAARRYGRPPEELTPAQRKNLSNGPGKLCAAFDIDRGMNGESLRGNRLFLCDSFGGRQKHAGEITASKRIGIDYAGEARDYLWRFTG